MKLRVLFMSVSLLATLTLTVAGQTSGEPKTAGQVPQLTEKDVTAVQQALYERGLFKVQPSGVLDAQTREALRQFQKQEGIPETGRIDRATIDKLGIVFPVTSTGKDSRRRNGVIPKIGYAIKDESTVAARAVGTAARKVGRGAASGAEKTADASQAAVGKTGETAKTAGDKSVDGARAVGRGLEKASGQVADATVGRSDESVHRDVRELLNRDDKTRNLVTQVKEGRVTIVSDAKTDTDLAPVISQMRKISGVRSVMVISR